MSSNLATYFSNESGAASAEAAPDDDMGPSVSMAVQAEDDEHFKRSTFNLKRTRSMGLLDGYIENGRESGSDTPPEAEESDTKDRGPDEEVDASALRYATRNPSESASPPVPENDNYLIPHDDNDLMYEPKRHVDYLSHQWKESEISQSWKYIILKKKKKDEDLVNAARLENASWRTWAKARNHLRTVSPEVVNWSKDSDVTWLYGPVVRQKSGEDAGSDQEYGYGSDDETSKRLTTIKPKKKNRGPKPILKRRTVSEVIEENSLWRLNIARQHRRDLSNTQDMMDGCGDNIYVDDDYDALAAKVNAQYYASQPPAPAHPQDSAVRSIKDEDRPVSRSNTPIDEAPSKTAVLESILTSSTRKTPKSGPEQKDRHIHFNDRVEQCMAIAFHSDDDDNDFDDSMDEDEHEGSAHHEYPRTRNRTGGTLNNTKDLYGTYSDEEFGSSSSDEDEAGLFINARFSRKGDSIHTPSVHSSLSSGSGFSKSSVTPIIQLLPATTLNYGSDEDDFDDDEEYYGNNAVSHNVNTFRGYDYMYDYNSVYTGDTSSFMAVNSCDMVDVPEGLQTPIEDHDVHPDMLEPGNTDSQLPSGSGKGMFSLDSDADSYSSDSESQFIEDSRDKSSEEELEGMPELKRVPSHGKSSTTSFQNFGPLPAALPPVIPQSHSFITGKPLRQTDLQSRETSTARIPAKSKGFLFDSESDSEDERSDENEPDSAEESADAVRRTAIERAGIDASTDSKLPYNLPTHGTAVSPPVSKPQRIPSGSPVNVATTGDSRTSLSDVAISGYISPRSESMQSVVAKENMVGKKSPSSDVDRMNKNLENWHINPQNEEQDDASPENVQKMMSSAREIASKYLHSWKPTSQ